MQIEICKPVASECPLALDVLLRTSPEDDRQREVMSLIESANRNEISLDGLRVARIDGEIVGVVLGVRQPDGLAYVYPPRVTGHAPSDTAALLAAQLQRWIESSGAEMAQCLTAVDDSSSHELLLRIGFEYLTDLVCWQHDLSEINEPRWPEACEAIPFSDLGTAAFERVLEAADVGSQDCSRLAGRRSVREILRGHLVAANDDTSRWWIYRLGIDELGVVLCAEQIDQRMWEVLYVGVVPKFRNRGFGSAMLCEVLHRARNAGANGVYLAADDANKMAAKCYAACGFHPAFRQRIHVWFPTEIARREFTSYAQAPTLDGA